jgi:hypothetical protein
MISEIIRDKKYQSRAFLLLPMTFNIGVIIGMQRTFLVSPALLADIVPQDQYLAGYWPTQQETTLVRSARLHG